MNYVLTMYNMHITFDCTTNVYIFAALVEKELPLWRRLPCQKVDISSAANHSPGTTTHLPGTPLLGRAGSTHLPGRAGSPGKQVLKFSIFFLSFYCGPPLEGGEYRPPPLKGGFKVMS